MAHAAKIGELTDGLVVSITGRSNSDSRFSQLKSGVWHDLRSHSHPRTNQFDVHERYEGLVEKFEVLNREDLAAALQARLDELPAKGKWLPELLSLLLQLSDRPAEKTKLDDLEALTRPKTPPPELTWDDIVAGDPLDRDEIWVDVERGYHSSGDEAAEDDQGSEATVSTQASSFAEDDFESLARLYIVQPDNCALVALRDAQAAATNEDPVVSELTLIRQTLAMLSGQPTDLYSRDLTSCSISLKKELKFVTASAASINDVASQCAQLATALHQLGSWTKRPLTLAYLESCQAATQEFLASFRQQLSRVEARFARPAVDTVVSLVSVLAEVKILARPLTLLSELASRTSSGHSQDDFALLDCLYGEACYAQLSGDESVFVLFTAALFAGLRTYLRSVLKWTTQGSLPSKDRSFFVEDATSDCELPKHWRDRYRLRLHADGRVSAPSFMQPFIEQVFALGKSRAFLSRLQGCTESTDDEQYRKRPPDFQPLGDEFQSDSLLPFSQSLHDAINQWIVGISKDYASTLRKIILYDCGLLRVLDALSLVYLSKDGMLFQEFASTLFDRMASRSGTWRDRFLLTELAQSTLGSASTMDASCISAVVESATARTFQSGMRALESVELTYAMSWPIQNITHEATPEAHARAFSFLLQLHRAKALLKPQYFDIRYLRSRQHIGRVSRALVSRQRLLWFIDIMHAHLTTTAFIISTSLRTCMREASGIDEMVTVYAEHKKRLEMSLLLTPKLKPIRDAVTDVLELCEMFAATWMTQKSEGGVSSCDRDLEGVEKAAAATVHVKSIAEIQEEMDRLVPFIAAGLRGVARAGGGSSLEALAESLNWSQ